jgi:hypothetical protein
LKVGRVEWGIFPIECSVSALLMRHNGIYGAVDRVF